MDEEKQVVRTVFVLAFVAVRCISRTDQQLYWALIKRERREGLFVEKRIDKELHCQFTTHGRRPVSWAPFPKLGDQVDWPPNVIEIHDKSVPCLIFGVASFDAKQACAVVWSMLSILDCI